MIMSKILNTHIYQEIFEQPVILKELTKHNLRSLGKIKNAIESHEIHHIVIAARGTSDNAGRYAKYLFGAHNQMVVSLATPSLFTIYKTPPNLEHALVLGISQSGQSPDINEVIDTSRKQGAITVAICNDTESRLANSAEFLLDIHAGPELSTAATKTYTGQLGLIAMLSKALVGEDATDQLETTAAAVEKALSLEPVISDLAEKLWSIRHLAVIGRGYNYSTAFEIALKIKELTYTMAAPYSSADFIHGPLALIEPGFPVILVAPAGELSSQFLDFISTMEDLGARLIVISDQDELLSRAEFPIQLQTSVPEWLSPIVSVIPGQLLALYLASLRGIHPDTPRTINKVTKTI